MGNPEKITPPPPAERGQSPGERGARAVQPSLDRAFRDPEFPGEFGDGRVFKVVAYDEPPGFGRESIEREGECPSSLFHDDRVLDPRFGIGDRLVKRVPSGGVAAHGAGEVAGMVPGADGREAGIRINAFAPSETGTPRRSRARPARPSPP